MFFQDKDLDFSYTHLDDENSSTASVIDNRVQSDKKRVLTLLAMAIVIIVWQGVWVPTNDFNTEKKMAEIQKNSYISSFEIGWKDQCEALFFRLGGIENYAFGKGIKFSYPECMSLKNASSAIDAFNENVGGYIWDSSTYDMKENGRNQANRDLLSLVFSMSPYWCFGSDCLAATDFGIYRP